MLSTVTPKTLTPERRATSPICIARPSRLSFRAAEGRHPLRLVHRARESGIRVLEQLQAQEPQVIVSANVGCIAHLQSGTSTPVAHWIELVEHMLSA